MKRASAPRTRRTDALHASLYLWRSYLHIQARVKFGTREVIPAHASPHVIAEKGDL